MSFMGKSSTTPKVFLGLRQQGDSREACSAGAVASPEGRTPGEKASIPLSSQPVKVKRLPRAPTASTIPLDEREPATRVTEGFARRPNRSNSPRRPRSFQEDGDQNSKGIRTSPPQPPRNPAPRMALYFALQSSHAIFFYARATRITSSMSWRY